METLIVSPRDAKKLKTIKVLLRALDIDFKSQKEKPYNPEFVKKIKQSEKDIREGRVYRIDIKDLWK